MVLIVEIIIVMSSNKNWKEVNDSKSGRVYYVCKETKETTWNKPLELATPHEREKMLRRREEQIQFFSEMEANIKRRLKEASLITISSSRGDRDHYCNNNNDNLPDFATLDYRGDYYFYLDSKPEENNDTVTRSTRSISSMDDDIIRTMRRTDSNAGLNTEFYVRTDSGDRSSFADFRLLSTRLRSSSNEFNNASDYFVPDAKVCNDMKRVDSRNFHVKQSKVNENRGRTYSRDKQLTMSDVLAEPKKSNNIGPFKRRNSTGTIFVETTMSNQDDEATITSVCIIIRTHMIIAAKERSQSAPQFDVFKDSNLSIEGTSPVSPTRRQSLMESVPSLNTIREYFKSIFSRSQLESECIIMTLIYIERLFKCTTGRLYIRHDNWKSILFSTLMMSSKVWDDLSMWNVDFSQAAKGFTLSHVNELEIAFLEAVGYNIRVSAGEYARYYFHLRSMMVKLGFTDYKKMVVAPLNIEGARRLQLASEKCEFYKTSTVRRTRSVVDIAGLEIANLRLEDSNSYADDNKVYKCIVGLEQIINENHTDADGSKKTSFSQRHKNSIIGRSITGSFSSNGGSFSAGGGSFSAGGGSLRSTTTTNDNSPNSRGSDLKESGDKDYRK